MALREALAREGNPMPIEGPDERDRFLLDGLEHQGREYGIAGVRNVVPGRWLVEGDQVDIGGHVFAVLHCPGHTPGHVVFHSAADRFALVGAVIFRGSVGATDFPYGDGPTSFARSARSCSHSATRSLPVRAWAGLDHRLGAAHQSLCRSRLIAAALAGRSACRRGGRLAPLSRNACPAASGKDTSLAAGGGG